MPAADPFLALRFLPGIGPARAAALSTIGLHTVWDVLHAVPRLLPPPPALFEQGPIPLVTQVRVRARVLQARPTFGRGRGLGIEARLERADGMVLLARFYNAGYLRRHLLPNEWYLWEGRTDDKRVGLLLHPAFEHLPSGATQAVADTTTCRVAYRTIEGISERAMATLAETCVRDYIASVDDPIGVLTPSDYQAALTQLHQPIDATHHEAARRLIAERELTALAWVMQQRRAEQTAGVGKLWLWTDLIHQRALARLPFPLTDGQQQALAEVRADLQAATPMYRLLSGDVGSGKTAVALVAILAVIANQAQALLLAPTAVLARQHAQFIAACLTGSRVRIGQLTGGTTPSESARLLAELQSGSLQLLIATHAALEDRVQFQALGLVVIDEQHKFGVEQRAVIINRAEQRQGWRPDLLLMTATPIPRTLALTAFGDLSISQIVDRPPGRAPVTTTVLTFKRLADIEPAIRAAVQTGGLVFVICPLRDASDQVTAADATQVHSQLATIFGHEQVGLLHGALPEAEKIAMMERFSSSGLRILVATTVVEVGIDVPAATLLIVLDADRFGLAQLHQLRGRIGRGTRAGQCLLYYRDNKQNQKNDPEIGANDALIRLQVLTENDDGLAIAEADLALRGPGQLLGTGQHGLCQFRVASLPRDLDLLQLAHASVRQRLAAGEPKPTVLLRLLAANDDHVLAGG